LVVLLTLQGVPLLELSRTFHWHPPAWLSVLPESVVTGVATLQTFAAHWVGQQLVQAHGQASRTYTIDPSCANPGSLVSITGNGFGAENVEIYVGGQETGHGIITGGLRAQLVSAYGSRATCIVPQEAPGSVSIVWAVNSGSHAGVSAFRVKQTEICGNSVDEDCDGQLDAVDICVPVNRSPLAEAGFPSTAPVGTTVHLDGSGARDGDGDRLTYQWSLLTPSTSAATLSDPISVTPRFTLDVVGDDTATLTVHDGTVASTPDTVDINTLNSPPVAKAGADTASQVGQTITLDGSGSSDVDGNALTSHWGLLSNPSGSTATLQNADTATPRFVLDRTGTYSAQLVVNDGLASSAPDTVTISTLNTKPVAKAGAWGAVQ
jgi:hypothetical protein